MSELYFFNLLFVFRLYLLKLHDLLLIDGDLFLELLSQNTLKVALKLNYQKSFFILSFKLLIKFSLKFLL
jgi:hypothetical protein